MKAIIHDRIRSLADDYYGEEGFRDGKAFSFWPDHIDFSETTPLNFIKNKQ